jgi:hypothetical protein
MGAQLINCTGVCGAAAEKPRSCGSKQSYGGVVDRVWRLGLQAKAKAATMALRWRVPEIQIIFHKYRVRVSGQQPVPQYHLQLGLMPHE